MSGTDRLASWEKAEAEETFSRKCAQWHGPYGDSDGSRSWKRARGTVRKATGMNQAWVLSNGMRMAK
jgi:hypothetical protein